MDKRLLEESIFKTIMIISLTIVIGSLVAVLGVIIYRGLPALNWQMLTQVPKGGYYLGKEGGILNAIVGSLLLASGSVILAMLISIPIALCLQREYISKRVASLVRFSLDVLWGVPSIVYGAFGFIVMVFFGLRSSLLGGIIALTLLMLPIMIRAMDEVIRIIPQDLKNASYLLGANRIETTFKVVFRQALPGILTAILLALGRGIGDAASILFTAGYSDFIPHSIFDSVASLPLAIFFQLATPFPEVQQRAYASALVLTIIVLAISFSTRLIIKRAERFVIK